MQDCLFAPLLGSAEIILNIPEKTKLKKQTIDNSRVLFNFYQGNGKYYDDRKDYTQIKYEGETWDLVPDKISNLGDTTYSNIKGSFIEDSEGYDTLDVSDFTHKEIRTLLRGLRQGKEFILLGTESRSPNGVLDNELSFVAFQDSSQIESIFTGEDIIVL